VELLLEPVAKDKIVTEDGQNVFAVWLCEGKCPETNKKCEYSVYEWGHDHAERSRERDGDHHRGDGNPPRVDY
jgi:hypothetical protein